MAVETDVNRTSPVSLAGGGPHRTGRWLATFNALPELVVEVTAGFGIPAMVLLLAGYFVVPLALSLGLVASAALIALGWPARMTAANPTREAWWTLGAVVVAVGFFVVNAAYSAQNIYATRDPATYSLAGEWLAHHHSILVSTDPDVFGHVPGVTGSSLGFYNDVSRADTEYAQGNHLLPAFLGMVSWLAGPEHLFHANSLIGALALLAMFGLVRRFAGGGFALVAVAALAVSMPMIGFSRDTYTEPLALLFLFGGLSLLWMAIESERPTHFLVAGLVLGSVALVRVDGYADLLAIVVVAGFLLARAPIGTRRAWFGRVGALAGGLVPVSAIGFLDAARLSSGYYHDVRSNVLALLGAAALLAVLAAIVVAVAWRTRLWHRMFASSRLPAWGNVAGIAVLALFAVLASRPLWMTAYGKCDPSNIGGLQGALGLPVEPCRSYAEHSVSWFAWYFGWPTLILGVLGLGLLVRHMVRTADARLLGLVAMVIALSALYLNAPHIYPDQVWAMRRFLPVVIPGLLGGAAYLLHRVATRRRMFQYSAMGLGVVAVVVPVVITHPMQVVRTGITRLDQIRAVCDVLPDDAAVLALGAPSSYTQTIRTYCDAPTQFMAEPTRQALAQVRANVEASGHHLYALTLNPAMIPMRFGSAGLPPLTTADVTKWPERLIDIPQDAHHHTERIYLGVVDERGHVEPITD